MIERDWKKLDKTGEAYNWLCGAVRSGLVIAWLQKTCHFPTVSQLDNVTVWEAGAGHEAWGLRQSGVRKVTAVDNASGIFWDSYYKKNKIFCDGVDYQSVSIHDWLLDQPDESQSLICAFGSQPNVIFPRWVVPIASEIWRVLRIGGVLLLEGDELADPRSLGPSFETKYHVVDLTELELPHYLIGLRYGPLSAERIARTTLGKVRISLSTRVS